MIDPGDGEPEIDPGDCGLFLARFKILLMAAVDSLLNDAATDSSPDPAPIQQFAAKNSYFVPSSATSPVWKFFRYRIDQNYKTDGALVFPYK